MVLNTILIQACYFIFSVACINSYVLFAANIDDFRSIAKKFIPGRLADQLADMASKNSIKYRQEKESAESEEDYASQEAKAPLIINSADLAAPKKRYAITNQLKDIDLDELVKRVKEKLDMEMKNTQAPKMKRVVVTPEKMMKNTHDYYYKEDNDSRNEDNEEAESQNSKNYEYEQIEKVSLVKGKATTERGHTVSEIIEYYNDNEETTDSPKNSDDPYLQEADLMQPNDSYEDYVTPKKEDNVFESAETTRPLAIIKKLAKIKPELAISKATVDTTQRAIYEAQDIYKEKAKKYEDKKSEEEKAKTENLWYDDSVVETTESSGPLSTGETVTKPIKKMKGTMIPTRERFKMSSPNYYAKLPAVAEKYNFDEPLPERDREPENLKYIDNPPALINKKVRLKF